MEYLDVEDDGAIRLIRLNRPEKRNALNHALTASLLQALRDADELHDLRAVVLCGAGRSFCAGADTSEFSALTPDDPGAIVARAHLTTALHQVFSTMSKPVVGAVHGHAMGGGAGLALACDLLVLADTALLGYPELKHGIVPAVVMANLVRQAGRKAAFELVSLGEPITARRAFELGLANRVVAEADMLDESRQLARILAGHPPLALASTKRLFHRVADLPLNEALQVGRDTNMLMRSFRWDGPREAGSRVVD